MFANTHTYDGNIPKSLVFVEGQMLPINDNVVDVIIDKAIILKFQPEAIFRLHIMKNDMGTLNNYDATNDLWVDELLMLCARHVHNIDFMQELHIQLMDMETGFCPQGRTHRIFQLLFCFKHIKYD